EETWRHLEDADDQHDRRDHDREDRDPFHEPAQPWHPQVHVDGRGRHEDEGDPPPPDRQPPPAGVGPPGWLWRDALHHLVADYRSHRAALRCSTAQMAMTTAMMTIMP